MHDLKILHIGIKNYPFESAFHNSDLNGLRGGGSNKYCSLLIESLPKSVGTIIITQKLKGEKKYEFVNNAHVYRLRTFGNRGIRQIILNIYSFFFSYKLIKKYRIKIIHGHMQMGILISYFLGKLFIVKIIGTPYSFVTEGKHFSMSKIAGLIEKHCYRRIDKLIFETEENRMKATELRNFTFSNSSVINTGVKLPKRVFIKEANQRKLNIFYIGRIVQIKALDKLILSFLHLKRELREQIRIDLIGEGELSGSLQRLIEKNNLSDYIKLHGFVNNTEEYYKNGDIFILPSDMEGLSISLLESMSYGKACIVNNFGVPFTNKELFIMDNNEPETIANTIRYFLDHKELIYSFGKNARKRIKKDFSIQSFSDKYVNVYKQLMN